MVSATQMRVSSLQIVRALLSGRCWHRRARRFVRLSLSARGERRLDVRDGGTLSVADWPAALGARRMHQACRTRPSAAARLSRVPPRRCANARQASVCRSTSSSDRSGL